MMHRVDTSPMPATDTSSAGKANLRAVLTLAAASERGQVAAVTALLERHGAYVEEFSVFNDEISDRFYVRGVFRIGSLEGQGAGSLATLGDDYAELLGHFRDAQGSVQPCDRQIPVLLMVSKSDHCLLELLAQWRRRELNMNVVAVVSNHADLAPLARAEGIAFHHLPVTPETKPAQEARLLELIDSLGAEKVVLARYMQVLSEDLCIRLAGRAINIHHSFLPGFKGARPYEQAHARGVKLIGATAHFVTTDLDEGPIIEQALERVDHAFTPLQLQSTGRHLESLVLARALRYVLEQRVFLNGKRTVVLR